MFESGSNPDENYTVYTKQEGNGVGKGLQVYECMYL